MSAALLSLVIVLVQTAAGAVWWRLARGRSAGPLETTGMGIALGTAIAAISGIVLFDVVPVQVAWAVPALLTVSALSLPVVRRRLAPTAWPATPWSPAVVALCVGLLGGLATLLVNLRNYPLSSVTPISTYHPDMLFFEALSTSLAQLGPGESIFMSGADLRYHWLTYAWAGQLTAAADAPPFLVLTRVLPLAALVATVLLATAWTQRLTRSRWAPTISVVLIVLGGYVGATYGTILNFDSPSQALTTPWLLALSIAALAAVRHRSLRPRALVALLAVTAALSAALTAGKVSSTTVAIAGICLVAIVATIRRDSWAGRAWFALLAMLVPAAVVFVLVLAGSGEQGGLGLASLLNKASSVQGLNPSTYWWGILAGTLILGIAVAARWAGVVWLIIDRRSRWRPVTLFSVGAGGVGFLALASFSGGFNDLWFALAASAPLSVTSAVGASRAVRATMPSRGWRPSVEVLAAIAGGAVLTGVVVLVWSGAVGLDLRWAGPLVALLGAALVGLAISRSRTNRRATAITASIACLLTMAALGRVLSLRADSFAVQPETGFAPAEFSPFVPYVTSIDTKPVTTWTPGMVEAAEWLAGQAMPDDLVATNLTYSPVVPALSRVPTWVSAIQYQAPYGRPSALPELLAREDASWIFTGSAGPYGAFLLCTGGVDWVWVDPQRSLVRDWSPYASVEFATDDALILRMNPDQCQELIENAG